MNIWKIARAVLSRVKGFAKAIVRFLLKTCIVIFFVLYVYIGLTSIGMIIDRENSMKISLGQLGDYIDKSVKMKKDRDIEVWLKNHVNDDFNTIEKVMEDKAEHLTPFLIIRLANMNFTLKNDEKALFWINLGKYRLRYDILRCGGKETVKFADEMLAIVDVLKIDEIYEKDPNALVRSLKQVIGFERKHPAVNNIDDVCQMVNAIEGKEKERIAEEYWGNLHEGLLLEAEKFIAEEEKKDKRATGEVKKTPSKSFNKSGHDF